MREPTEDEIREAAFLAGVVRAFRLRGFPSSFPRRVLFVAEDAALHILAGGKVGQMDEPQINTMRSTANEFGWDVYKPRATAEG